jgi:hypothetical protein
MSPRQHVDDPWEWHHIFAFAWVPIVIALYVFDATWIIDKPMKSMQVESPLLSILIYITAGVGSLFAVGYIDHSLLARRSQRYRRVFRNLHWPRYVLDYSVYGPTLWFMFLCFAYALMNFIRLLSGFKA